MEFLHHHHSGEDQLWPIVRERNASAHALLDQMEADHRHIGPAIVGVTAAGRAYAQSPTERVRAALVDALESLQVVLVPHLQAEVDQMMPVVASTLTEREWKDWDRAYNIKPKSLSQLGTEGHWLLEGIDPQGYELVVHLVPPIPRFVLLHGFAHRYRRQAAQRWLPAPALKD